MPTWKAVQFGEVVSRFKRSCPQDAWDDILISYAFLLEMGPAAGTSVAKKLVNAKGIWELIGRSGNNQPRMLFYFDELTIVFVHAFLKKGKQNYLPAIALAHSRRKLIERGEKEPNVIQELEPYSRH